MEPISTHQRVQSHVDRAAIRRQSVPRVAGDVAKVAGLEVVIAARRAAGIDPIRRRLRACRPAEELAAAGQVEPGVGEVMDAIGCRRQTLCIDTRCLTMRRPPGTTRLHTPCYRQSEAY